MVNRKPPTNRRSKKPVQAKPESTPSGEQNMTNTIRVRYRFKDTEFEAEGPVEEVNRHTLEYLSRAHRPPSMQEVTHMDAPNLQLSFLGQNEDAPRLADQSASIANGVMSTAVIPEPIDICTLFTMCSPKTQADQVMLIIYHCKIHRRLEPVSYDDIDVGFLQLARCGVPTPTNPRMVIKQLIEKDQLLYRPNRANGEFALTIHGEEYMKMRLAGGPN